MPGRWVVTIPGWHPARINELYAGCWQQRARLKRADRDVVAAHVRQAEVPPATLKRRVGLLIVLGPRQRAADVDAYHKSLLDALKACRAIVDDSRQWVTIGEPTFTRGPAKATVITLEDVEVEA